MGEAAFVAVAVMAVGNASGRIVAGVLSDRIGRKFTLMLVLLLQALLMFAAIPVTSAGSTSLLIVLVATGIGFNYGANLSLFPSITKDFWGLRNFGMNYGCLFTAWGLGGFALSRLQQMLKSSGGNFNSSFVTAGVLLLLGAVLSLALGTPRTRES
jgi:MFS family permease